MFQLFSGDTANDVWLQMVTAFRSGEGVARQPSRAGPTSEMLHVATSVNDPRQRWVASRNPALNPAFALADLVWLINGRNDAALPTYFNRRLPEYAGDGPTFHGAYGFRLQKHFGMNQLDEVFRALQANPETRQAVLQLWDPRCDLPGAGGEPRSRDIPCNVTSLLKVREGCLEWTQIIRSNDLFLGVPYNFVQFTCVQEILAGWLDLEVGSYNQVSDSLHVYDRDWDQVLQSTPIAALRNTDSLAVSRSVSEMTFGELAKRLDSYVTEKLSRKEHVELARWQDIPKGFRNIHAILAAEGARRRRWVEEAAVIADECDNPALKQMWQLWYERVEGS